jgi:phage I-like protein
MKDVLQQLLQKMGINVEVGDDLDEATAGRIADALCEPARRNLRHIRIDAALAKGELFEEDVESVQELFEGRGLDELNSFIETLQKRKTRPLAPNPLSSEQERINKQVGLSRENFEKWNHWLPAKN